MQPVNNGLDLGIINQYGMSGLSVIQGKSVVAKERSSLKYEAVTFGGVRAALQQDWDTSRVAKVSMNIRQEQGRAKYFKIVSDLTRWECTV